MTNKSRLGLRTSLDRDVYHIVSKLEASSHRDKPLASVSAVYEAIKASNSSLARLKKRPLEEAINQVLKIRKQELEDDGSEDSDAAIDNHESEPKAEKGGFLLNRQMVKLWNTDCEVNGQPVTKKRRTHTDGDDDGERSSGPGTNTIAPIKIDKPQARKQQKSRRFAVEQPGRLLPLGGADEVFSRLLTVAWVLLRCSDRYRSISPRLTPGILLSGPSGVGKKTMVRNVAATLGVPLISLKGCFHDDPDRTERSLSEATDTAISLSPSIVFLEHVDRYMPRPGSSSHGEQHFRTAACAFADQMERIRSSRGKNGHVLAIATTSRLTDIDPIVLSFDLLEMTFHMQIPDCDSRRDIMRAITANMKLADDVDLLELARMTHGYVGADLAAIATLAGISFKKRTAIARLPTRAILDLCDHIRKGRDAVEDPDHPSHFFAKTMTDPPPLACLTMEDFKAAIKEFTPSGRKEGFSVVPSVTWDQVGALAEARKRLKRSIIGPIKNPQLYQDYGLTRPEGVLLWGPPGCGKTLVAQAVANEAQASFILINGPELLNKYVGESERAVRELFQRARSSKPCILFFDEIDSIVPPRNNSSTETGARVVNALLTELDGAKDRSGIYVIGTTNRPEMIDEAMLRPGRLGVQVLVDLPTPRERVDILRAIYRTRHEHANEESLERLGAVALDARCADFSGADLAGLHTKAAEHGVERYENGATERTIIEEDWEYALDNTRSSVKDASTYKSYTVR
ncbi:hypothetical protein L249_6065 [Ophiocordyceps polyrhachis-furcata BCC 54312]|uniref:Peroxisomal ATPase PEX1 n=1 Tax=Ophiocordyceps polyrhachis-furcata BCC 54312 TaxID=1330021 RepID=A0A367LIS5_9HYPO|nr:hypothetical protein L249_6065 [Ophiocordyceps polyrhachis-furcata BCC 54312]